MGDTERDKFLSAIAASEAGVSNVLRHLYTKAEELFGGNPEVIRSLSELHEQAEKAIEAGDSYCKIIETTNLESDVPLKDRVLLEGYICYKGAKRAYTDLAIPLTSRAERIQENVSLMQDNQTAVHPQGFIYERFIPVLCNLWRYYIFFHMSFLRADEVAKLLTNKRVSSLNPKLKCGILRDLSGSLELGLDFFGRFRSSLWDLIGSTDPIPWALGHILGELLLIDPWCLTSSMETYELEEKYELLSNKQRTQLVQIANKFALEIREEMMEYVFDLMPRLIKRLCSQGSLLPSFLQRLVPNHADSLELVAHGHLISIKGAKELLQWIDTELSVKGGWKDMSELLDPLSQFIKQNNAIIAQLPAALCLYGDLLPEQQEQVQARVGANSHRLLFLGNFVYAVYHFTKTLPSENAVRHQLVKFVTEFGNQLIFTCTQLWENGPLLVPCYPSQNDEGDNIVVESEDDILIEGEDDDQLLREFLKQWEEPGSAVDGDGEENQQF